MRKMIERKSEEGKRNRAFFSTLFIFSKKCVQASNPRNSCVLAIPDY